MHKHEQIKQLREEGFSFSEIATLVDSSTNYVRDVCHGDSAISFKCNGNTPWRCTDCGGLVVGRRCKLCALRSEMGVT